MKCQIYGEISFIDFSTIITVAFLHRYNIGHIGISLGDLGLAYQAFKVAVSINSAHGEALNNIAVLEMRRQKFDVAKSCLSASCDMCPHIFEPLFNSGLFIFIFRFVELSYVLFSTHVLSNGRFSRCFYFRRQSYKSLSKSSGFSRITVSPSENFSQHLMFLTDIKYAIR